MRGLCFVATRRQRRERAPAQQSHPVLRIAHFAARGELEGTPGCLVREPPPAGHLREVREAVADHELGLACRRDEVRNRLGGMLAVGVDHEHGVGAARVVDAGADG